MENQDKIYEIEINSCGIGGKLRIQNRNNLRYNKNSYVDGNVVREHLCLSKEEYELAMLNLFRLYCCEGFHQEASAMYFGNIPIQANGGIEKFRITALGYKLLDMILDKD